MTDQSKQYGVVLANGRVIDPETYLDGIFNVGINGGQIAAISDQAPQGQGGHRCNRHDRLPRFHRSARPRHEHSKQPHPGLRWPDHLRWSLRAVFFP